MYTSTHTFFFSFCNSLASISHNWDGNPGNPRLRCCLLWAFLMRVAWLLEVRNIHDNMYMYKAMIYLYVEYVYKLYIYIYIYMYTHMHTYTYMYMQMYMNMYMYE